MDRTDTPVAVTPLLWVGSSIPEDREGQAVLCTNSSQAALIVEQGFIAIVSSYAAAKNTLYYMGATLAEANAAVRRAEHGLLAG